MNAWTELTEFEHNDVWDRFYSAFDFQPSIQPINWPGICEPLPSETYKIGHIYGNSEAQHLEEDLNLSALKAFRSCVGMHEPLYALDWQHSCYWFRPHLLGENDPWGVPSLPQWRLLHISRI
jgi:hypothetical protein